MTISVDILARELLDVVPPIMRTIRKKWKKGPIGGVTNSQFRILMFIQKKPGASLQDVAHHLGLTSPTTSTTVDELVSNHLVLRESSIEDRRKITLSLTTEGQKTLEEVFEHSRNDLAACLSLLTVEERAIVFQAMKLLTPLFSPRMEQKETALIEGEKI
jgi:DNA-binding MarR family transcriptional regulator